MKYDPRDHLMKTFYSLQLIYRHKFQGSTETVDF